MFKTWVGGILAGLSIAMGGTVFLLCESRIAGSLFFAVGLFAVCVFRFNLFTGRVCYVLDNDSKYARSLLSIWMGNLIGAAVLALIEMPTRLGPKLAEAAAKVCASKLSQGYLSAFLLAMLCNLLIYIAVEGYKTIPHETGKYLAILFGVSVFVYCGFEHCVANMYYFTMGSAWSPQTLLYLLVMTAGNAVGGVVLPLMRKAQGQ